LEKHILNSNCKIAQALEILSNLGHDLTLFIVNENRILVGTLTDGDIRRGLLKGIEIFGSVETLMNRNFRFITEENTDVEKIKAFKEIGIILLPVLNKEHRIIKIINLASLESLLPVSVVVMAGGEGKRLRPLTEKTPKSLLQVGDKPILEHVVDRFVKFGINDINITINYLGDLIENYFKNGESKGISIKYVKETKKLGTAGSISLVRDFKHDVVLLMNADLLTNVNFEDFYLQFKESGADLMVACIPYVVNIPYAVLEINNDEVKSLKEKPKYTYYSNAGIYLFKKEVITLIPNNDFYDATDLISELIALNKKVSYYPILNFWLDIGNIDDYNKANEFLKHNRI